MSPVCPATGHLILRIEGQYCSDHGVPGFEACPSCGAVWPLVYPMDDFAASELFPLYSEQAKDFCAGCGSPGQWLSRERRIEWIRHSIQADPTIPNAARLDLLAAMERLRGMDANDTRAVAGWEQVRKLAPKVWEKTKPVRDTLIGELVKKALETLGS